jgi:hypothetical protein
MTLQVNVLSKMPMGERPILNYFRFAFWILLYPLTAYAETAQELYTYLKRGDISPDNAVDHLHNSQPDPDSGEPMSDSVPPRAYVLEDLLGFNELTHAQQDFILWRARSCAGDHANSSGFSATQRIKWNRFQSRLAFQWIKWYEAHEMANDWKDEEGFDHSLRTGHYQSSVYYAGDGLISANVALGSESDKYYIQACDHFASYVGDQITPRWLETWEKALFGSRQMSWEPGALDTALCTLKDTQGMRQVDVASLGRWKKYADALERFLKLSPNLPRHDFSEARLKLVRQRIRVAERRVLDGNHPAPPRHVTGP